MSEQGVFSGTAAFASSPVSGIEIPSANTGEVRLCLPQLSINGLSETWLLKQCGSIHWSSLASAFGMPPQAMADREGNRLYPSFIALRLLGAPLASFHEGANLRFQIVLEQVSRTRFLSRQLVQDGSGSASVVVEMLTSFLRRDRQQDNSMLSAGTLHSLNGLKRQLPCNRDSELPKLDQIIRSCKWTEYNGYQREAATVEFDFRYIPSPFSDFNGAGLLYFAQYQDIVDRAEWALHHHTALLAATTVERQMFYFANLNPGDIVRVLLMDFKVTSHRITYRARLLRGSDNRLMAEVFTTKVAERSLADLYSN